MKALRLGIRRPLLLAGAPLLFAVASCDTPSNAPCGQGTEIGLGQSYYYFKTDLAAGQTCAWPLVMSGGATGGTDYDTLAELALIEGKATLAVDGYGEAEAGWVSTHPYAAGGHVIRVTATEAGTVQVKLTVEGPENTVRSDRCVNLTDPQLTADPMTAGMAAMMAISAEDSHGGRLLAQWLAAFGDPAVGARAGPVAFLDYLKTTYGADPSKWDMTQLPFSTASIQNRIDLLDGSSCGEVRVVIAVAVTDPAHADFNDLSFLFRFRQPAGTLDRSPGGVAYCDDLARRWAALGVMTNPDQRFVATNALLDHALSRTNFLAAQTSEAIGTGGSWEFREWLRAPNPDVATQAQLPSIMVTHPLPMTVDTPRLNQAGADRDAFLAFVEANAAGLDRRTVAIPDADHPQTAQVTEGAWTPLDLTGVSPATLSTYPNLRKHIEVVGCTGCHIASSGMRFSIPNSTPLGFFSDEISARRVLLEGLQRGELPTRGYDPLQANPTLPP